MRVLVQSCSTSATEAGFTPAQDQALVSCVACMKPQLLLVFNFDAGLSEYPLFLQPHWFQPANASALRGHIRAQLLDLFRQQVPLHPHTERASATLLSGTLLAHSLAYKLPVCMRLQLLWQRVADYLFSLTTLLL